MATSRGFFGLAAVAGWGVLVVVVLMVDPMSSDAVKCQK